MIAQGRAFAAGIAAPLLLTVLYIGLAFPVLGEGISVPVMAATGVLGAALLALSIIDIRTMRLPDLITLPLTGAGLIVTDLVTSGDLGWHAAAAAAGFLALYLIARGYRALRGRDGLGLGDAKLFAAAGAWLGLEGLPAVMMWASGAALAAVILVSLVHRPLDGSTRIPFGPFIAIGVWLVWLYGPPV